MPERVIVTGHRDHEGVVGGERGGRNTQCNIGVVTGDILGKNTADMGIGRDATTDDERLGARLFERSRRLLPQHLRHRIFKLAGNRLLHFISNHKIRRSAIFVDRWLKQVAHGRLES